MFFDPGALNRCAQSSRYILQTIFSNISLNFCRYVDLYASDILNIRILMFAVYLFQKRDIFIRMKFLNIIFENLLEQNVSLHTRRYEFINLFISILKLVIVICYNSLTHMKNSLCTESFRIDVGNMFFTSEDFNSFLVFGNSTSDKRAPHC